MKIIKNFKILILLLCALCASCVFDPDPYGVDHLFHEDMEGTWMISSRTPGTISYMVIERYDSQTLKIRDSLSMDRVKIYRAIVREDFDGNDTLSYYIYDWADTSFANRYLEIGGSKPFPFYIHFDKLSPTKMDIYTNYYQILNWRGYYSPTILYAQLI